MRPHGGLENRLGVWWALGCCHTEEHKFAICILHLCYGYPCLLMQCFYRSPSLLLSHFYPQPCPLLSLFIPDQGPCYPFLSPNTSEFRVIALSLRAGGRPMGLKQWLASPVFVTAGPPLTKVCPRPYPGMQNTSSTHQVSRNRWNKLIRAPTTPPCNSYWNPIVF